MKKSDALKQTRTAKVDAQVAVVQRAKDENREMTPEETAQFDALQGEIRSLDGEIERALIIEGREAEIAARSAGEPTPSGEEREFGKLQERFSLHRAINGHRSGVLTGVEKEIHEEMSKRAQRAGVAIGGVAIPMGATRAAGQTVTQDSGANGGNLVNTEMGEVIEFLRPQPIVEKLGARMLRGLTGNVVFPKNNGGIVAAWEGEVDETANSKNGYGKVEMKPKRLSAAVLISLQNLIQSSPDLEAMTRRDMELAVQIALDTAAINGSGTGDQPLGVLNTVGVNSLAMGTNGGVPTFEKLVEMETLADVENALTDTMAYLSTPGVRGLLKTTPLAANNAGFVLGNDGMVNGYKFQSSNLVPKNLTKGTSTGNCHAGIFGDFSQLMIGEWGFADLTVDDISQKKSGNIEIVLNSFYDIAVRQAKAFTVVKDFTLS